MMINRGVIRCRDHSTQVIDYSGLRYGKITPTNIDGGVDFGGKAFVYLEYKYGDAPLPRGQELHLERLIANLRVPALAIVATHDEGPGEPCPLCGAREAPDIDGANCTVVRKYRPSGWLTLAITRTVGEEIDSFLTRNGLDYPRQVRPP